MIRPFRQFQSIGLLRAARRGMTAEALARRREVSRRTVHCDRAGLQAMGILVDGAMGVGHVLRPGFDLPPPAFSADAAEAVRLALALLPRTGPHGGGRIGGLQAGRRGSRQGLGLERDPRRPGPGCAAPGGSRRAGAAAEVCRRSRDGNASRGAAVGPDLFRRGAGARRLVPPQGRLRHFRLDRIGGATGTGERFGAARAEPLRSLARNRT
ncbi:MAG: HTH domain-containing protein [Rhodobacteraceae bacterium]|nr:HTH domain-containing protein [Paracoccaceae bacterium]